MKFVLDCRHIASLGLTDDCDWGQRSSKYNDERTAVKHNAVVANDEA